MSLLNNYFDIQNQIYKYFGYEETWRTLPINDNRQHYWCLDEHSSTIHWADSEQELTTKTGNSYSGEIYKDACHLKSIYRGKNYTMVLVDTHAYGNQWMAIFDNAKEVKGSPESE